MERKKPAINGFYGKYRFLSNFYPVSITIDGITFPTAEHVYQAAKSTKSEDWKLILSDPNPIHAKQMGRKITLRPDWDNVKLDIMREIITLKFKEDFLIWKLWDTQYYELIEVNNWGDTFWGVCNNIGKNHLGIILMEHRDKTAKGVK